MEKSYSKMKNNELRVLLIEREIELSNVIDDDGKLIRKAAYAKLKKWDEEHPTPKKDRMMKVVFHKTPEETAAPFVFLALNGKAYQAPFEKEVEIPETVIRACCDHAKRREFINTGETDENHRVIYNEVEIHTQPYTFIEYVDKED